MGLSWFKKKSDLPKIEYQKERRIKDYPEMATTKCHLCGKQFSDRYQVFNSDFFDSVGAEFICPGLRIRKNMSALCNITDTSHIEQHPFHQGCMLKYFDDNGGPTSVFKVNSQKLADHQMTWTDFWYEFQDKVLARTNRNLDTNYTWENRPIGEMEDEYDRKTKKQYESEFMKVRDAIVKENNIIITEDFCPKCGGKLDDGDDGHSCNS